MHEWLHGQLYGWLHEWLHGQLHEWLHGQLYGRLHEWLHGRLHEWLHGQLYEWLNGLHWRNIQSNPDNAPVTSGAAAFLANGIAIGSNLLPKLINDPHKLPPCLTAFLICVFDILISDPVPWFIAFFNLLI